MIRKLKWKFVIVMMTITTVMLVIIFTLFLYTTRSGYVQRSISAMQAVLNNDAVFPGNPPHPGGRDPIVLVEQSEDGKLTILKNGPGFSEEDLTRLTAAARQDRLPFGELKEHSISATSADPAAGQMPLVLYS